MKRNSLVVFTTTLFSTAVFAAETNSWTYDLSFYGLAAGMSGKTGIGPVNADIDVGFDKIWDHLKLAGMGTARVGYGRWAISTDVIYMGLEGEKNQVTSKVGQWMVQPVLEYEICRYFGLYAGTRYNNIHLEIDGPFQRNPSATHDWWDPIIGARVQTPVWRSFSFGVSGDFGGFGVGADRTWQAFPCFHWQFTDHASLQAGYRWVYNDYESGSGLNRFKYDILTQGPQIGFTYRF